MCATAACAPRHKTARTSETFAQERFTQKAHSPGPIGSGECEILGKFGCYKSQQLVTSGCDGCCYVRQFGGWWGVSAVLYGMSRGMAGGECNRELPRIHLPGNTVNKGKRKAGADGTPALCLAIPPYERGYL